MNISWSIIRKIGDILGLGRGVFIRPRVSRQNPLILIFLSCCATVASAQTSSVNANTTTTANSTSQTIVGYQIGQQDGNSRVWQKIVKITDAQGNYTYQTNNAYTELATGLNHLVNGQWTASKEEVDILPDGTAVATNGQHQAYFPGDIYSGEIELATPDGKQLYSRPVGLSYDDGTRTVLIAELTNSTGEVVDDNQVIYPNAFVGVDADIRYTYTKAGFEQDIILRGQQPSPASFGLNPGTARLQVLTEFFNPPQPVVNARTVPTTAGNLEDDSLNFGTMRMIPGRAFLLGTNSPSTRVNKQWLTLNGRQILVEELPVADIAAQLESLPLPQTTSIQPNSPLNVVSSKRLLPLPKLAKATKAKMTLAMSGGVSVRASRSSKGLVLDYMTIVGSVGDYTFQSDTTYYVTGPFDVSGTTTIEGGAVIKYDEAGDYEDGGIYPLGAVTCETTPYRPAIITSADDNSAGATISGSSGTPSRYDCSALDFDISPTFNGPLEYLHIRYAAVGLTFGAVTPAPVRHCQFINVGDGVQNYDSGTVTVENCLFSGVTGYALGADDYPWSIVFTAANLTVHNAAHLIGSGVTLSVVNSLFSQVTDMSGVTLDATSKTVSDDSPFTTAGAGDFYVTDDSTYRIGTMNIDPVLLADLRQMTTYPPTIVANQTISSPAPWYQTVSRENGYSSLMIGYHYPTLDYLVSAVNVQNTTLTLGQGVAVAVYGSYGLVTYTDGQLVSQGTPLTHNQLCFYPAVQEQPVKLGGALPSGLMEWNGEEPPAVVNAQFTDFNGMSGMLNLAEGDSFQIQLWSCRIGPGYFSPNSPPGGSYSDGITNNLFERATLDIGTFDYMCHVYFYNNTVINSTVEIDASYALSGYRVIKDNLFDHSTVNVAYPGYVTYGYNAYYGGSTTLSPYHTGDFSLTALAYADGLWGNRYIDPSTSPTLVDKGDVTADQRGLYHYTTQVSQQKEANSQVDIGFHYVATDVSGNPMDTDGDDLPDYVEDANGNGVYDAADSSDWQNPFTDGSGMDDGWEVRYFGNINIDPYADPDGDGYGNLEEYQNGTNPRVFNSPPKSVSTVQVLHDQANPANIDVTWNSVPSATGYTITRTIGTTVTTYTVPAGTTSWTDTSVPVGSSPTYTVTPNYAGGGTPTPSPSGNADTNPLLAIDPEIVRGPTPSDTSLTPLQIVLGGPVPSNVQKIRVYKRAAGVYYIQEFSGSSSYGPYNYWTFDPYFGDLSWDWQGDTYDGYFDVPISSFVNGVYQIPVNQAQEWCAYYFQTQPIGTDGRGGVINAPVFARNVPFMDGSAVLKDNLRFIMRAGQTGDPNAADRALVDFSANPDYAAVSPTIQNIDTVSLTANYGLLTEVAPYDENWTMKNFAYDTGFASFDYYGPSYYFFWWDKDIAQNLLPNIYGVDPAGGHGAPYVKYQFDGYDFVQNGNTSLLNSQLAGNPFVYLGDDVPAALGYDIFGPADYAGLSWDNINQQTDLASGYANYFGLPYQSVRVTDSLDPLNKQYDIPAGGAYSDPDPNDYSEYFQNVTPPTLTTVDYYFTQLSDLTSPYAATIYPKPNDSNFSVNQTTPLLITAVGQEAGILGWAKQSISVGGTTVPNKFGYLGQYFDPTSVSGAILSEYGDFFALQPGQFTLKTKADPDQGGMQGSCTVYAMSLNVDANHDGNMDVTYGGPDTTSATTPMEFWVNNDNDGTGVGQDNPVLKTKYPPDYSQNVIQSERDLEDFARLWISGVPDLITGNYQITLHWRNYTGNPAIKLYLDQLAGGEISYLTSPDMAQNIVDNPNSEFLYCTVSAGTDFVFSDPGFFDGSTKHFLFEGVSPGRGELVLTISQNGNTIAETSVWLDLHDVKDFYERAVITDSTSGAISTWSSTINSIQPALASALGDDQNLIVFVHGINVPNVDWLIDSDTVFKRLYWSGYHGKFMTVDWPCNLINYLTFLTLDVDDFNDSELKAYKASSAMATYLNQLRIRFPSYHLNLFVHSQGNSVVSEAIEQGAPFDNYILTQGALPASCYDANALTDPTLVGRESYFQTPELQPMGYRSIYVNLPGNIVDFYNSHDKVLGYWYDAQEFFKPSIGYSYDGTKSTYTGTLLSYTVTDSQESRANVSRSRTLAIGQEGANGVISSTIDLNAQFGFNGSTTDEHSAQWTRPIQTCWGYYDQILESFLIPTIQR